ncbi:MAG: L,D-transpeptidase family protein [Candidatus Hydrogenedentales bacterium]|jgi:hypothetical protein
MTRNRLNLQVRKAIALGLVLAAGLLFYHYGRSYWTPLYYRLMGERSVAEVVATLEPTAGAAWRARCAGHGVAFPPAHITLICIKDRRTLEVWFDGPPAVKATEYSLTAFSGKLGPKLREGDMQIPEGTYPLTALNPNSAFHLSVRVGYPNPFDEAWAAEEGRTNLGGDIYIHGKKATIGCIAIGDAAIEEVFYLVQAVGLKNSRIIITPTDFRVEEASDSKDAPAKVRELHGAIAEALQAYSTTPMKEGV